MKSIIAPDGEAFSLFAFEDTTTTRNWIYNVIQGEMFKDYSDVFVAFISRYFMWG